MPQNDQLATPVDPVHTVHTTNELQAIIHEEIRNAFGVEMVAYNTREAALVVGLRSSCIQAAVRRNELVARYFGNKPILTAAELLRWVESLPVEHTRCGG